MAQQIGSGTQRSKGTLIMFEVQVRIKEYNAGAWIHVWRSVRPSGARSLPYQWPTKDAARLARDRMNDGSRTLDDFRIVDVANNREV